MAPCSYHAEAYKRQLERFRQDLPNMPYSPAYREKLEPVIGARLSDPLDALRQQVGEKAESIFKKIGQRKIVVGCMHYPNDATEEYRQTQTMATNLLPKTLPRNGEDHSHADALTIDLRALPGEVVELRFSPEFALKAKTYTKLNAYSPDFAGRDLVKQSDFEDFKHVNEVEKIYLERVPMFEMGPTTEGTYENIHLFKAWREMLAFGGVLAFDFTPPLSVSDPERPPPPTLTEKIVTQEEINAFIKDSPFSEYLQNNPAEAEDMAIKAIRFGDQQEQLKKQIDQKREKVKSKPPADVTLQELFIQFNQERRPLEKIDEHFLWASDFASPNLLVIGEERTAEEMHSIRFQAECYRALNVDPSLEVFISKKTKQVLDTAYTILVEKVVFPRLELMGFKRVQFEPNGTNPENRRRFDRVVHVKKV